MASSLPFPGDETAQAANIPRHDPSVLVDAAPETAADEKEELALEGVPREEEEEDDDEEDEDGDEDEDEDEWNNASSSDHHHHDHARGLLSSYSTALGRNHHHLPPLPDLRFQQSYLNSITAADTWWKIGLVTVRDQVLMPLVQGVLYNLAVCGWQYWNKSAQLGGKSVGSRARRWWYGVNNWPLPKVKAA